MENLAYDLKEVTLRLEEMNSFYISENSKDLNFQGLMAEAYQYNIKELYTQHQKTIQLYQALYKELIEMVKDFEDIESTLLNRLDNL